MYVFLLHFRAYCERRSNNGWLYWSLDLGGTTYHMTIYGPSPGPGSLADWLPSPVPVCNQRGGVIVFFVLFFVPLWIIRYLYRFAARGRHIAKRVKWRRREEAGPGPVQWTPEQWSAVGIGALKIVECLNPPPPPSSVWLTLDFCWPNVLGSLKIDFLVETHWRRWAPTSARGDPRLDQQDASPAGWSVWHFHRLQCGRRLF